MKSLFKVMFVAGVMALSLAATEREAQAHVAGAQAGTGAQTDTLLSSYYGSELAGSPTASGEPFDPNGLTAASPYLPLGTKLQVCYDECVVVEVNDRGPYVGGRQLDLSQGAAEATGLINAGVDYVDVRVLSR